MYAGEVATQLKREYYNYKMFYASLMETTKQKSIVDIQKRKESKHTPTEKSSNHKDSKRGRTEQRVCKAPRKQLTKCQLLSPYLSIITLNVN